AVKEGDLARAEALLGSEQGRIDIGLLPGEHDAAIYAAEKSLALMRLIAQGAPVESLFAALNRFRLLCALKQGPAGSIELNQRIVSRLQQVGVPIEGEWFPGRPIMVTSNDYQLKLFNGDIGITLPDPRRGGEMGVVFQGEGEALRWLAPTRLPPHETVFAMTVHKSQGSEFEEVLLLLPHRDTPLLSRELIYTAITRARTHFMLSSPVELFQTAVKRRLIRQSGLADLLVPAAAELF
ncbi:MAG: ATP-binding domain-containing protein, partial [Pseudomonadota bacterium]